MKNIFLDFLNPDYLRALCFSDDHSSLEQEKTLELGFITSFLLTKEFLYLPPTFYLESETVREICLKYKILIDSDVLKFPMRDRSFKTLFEKKISEYKDVMHHYEGMEKFLKHTPTLSFLSNARISRVSNVGKEIVSSWESGADEDVFWSSFIAEFSFQEIEILRASPRKVLSKEKAITWGEVSKENNHSSLEKITQILAQRYYTKVYVNEYEAAVLSNFPYLHNLFGLAKYNYDYNLFWMFLFHTGLKKYICMLTPEKLVKFKHSEGFIKFRNLYFYFLEQEDSGVIIKSTGSILFNNNGFNNSLKSLQNSVNSDEFIDRLIDSTYIVSNFFMNIFKTDLNEKPKNKGLIMENIERPSIAVFVALGEEERILNESLQCTEQNGSHNLHNILAGMDIILFSPGQMGRVPAAVSTMHFLNKADKLPDLILIVGIAGGFEKQNIRVQDVLIPDYVYDMASTKAYEKKDEKHGTVEREFRTIPYSLDQKISKYVNSSRFGKRSWAANASGYARCVDDFVPRIITSPISSGDEVVANEEWPINALKIHPKICGVEMEAGGVCAAAEVFNVPVAMIRGVSDHANPAKSDDEGRKKAMYIASHLTKYLIENHDKWWK